MAYILRNDMKASIIVIALAVLCAISCVSCTYTSGLLDKEDECTTSEGEDGADMQGQQDAGQYSGGRHMLHLVGTITAISDDKVVISTESGEVETDCSALKYDGKYPRYFVPGIEITAYYFPDEKSKDGLIEIKDVIPESSADEVAEGKDQSVES